MPPLESELPPSPLETGTGPPPGLDSEGSVATATAVPEPLPVAGEQPPESNAFTGFGREFVTAFVAIFLAEIGDKTQLSTLLMTAESHAPWVVFAGAAAALITTSLIGVVLGRWLAAHLSPQKLKVATGVGLLFIAASMMWDLVGLHFSLPLALFSGG